MQIARDEANFKEFMDKLRVEKEREEQRKKMRHENKYKYRDEIISQMTQKQMKKREADEKAKREQLASVEAERQRELWDLVSAIWRLLFNLFKFHYFLRNIKHIIQTKIRDMKRNNIPEKFIKDVERQLTVFRTWIFP